MKRIGLLFFAFLFVLSPAVRALELTLSAEGVVINAGAIGQFVVPAPSLETSDKQELKPSLTLSSESDALATYANGFVVKIAINAAEKTIRYSFAQPPANASSLKLTTLLPINLNQGGTFTLGKTSGTFPQTKSGQFLAHGEADRFDLVHPLGEGLRFSTPGAYQQLQDNRTWDWNVFAWIYRHDLKRYAGKTAFTLRLSTFTAGQRKFLVDRFGQSARVDYAGKIEAETELRADIENEKKFTQSLPNSAHPLDRFGGLAESGAKLGFKKSGFFYAATTTDNRHVLVDPEGNAFFQLGVCGIANTDDFTTVKGREKTYEWLPDIKDPAWTTAWRSNQPTWGIFSFQIANWIRKYEQPYSYEKWTGQAVDRLRSWGFNSAGAFSTYSETMRERGFPTVSFLPSGNAQGVKNLPDKVGASELMDPFAAGTETALDKAYSSSVAKNANDPLIIGYFLGNEQHFELLPKLIPSYKASAVAAKTKLVEQLIANYGDIARFNAAWAPAKPFTDFEQLKEAPLFIQTDAAAADMRAFTQLYLETYYSLIRRTFKKHDQNHLLIGSRWTPHTANSEDVVRIGGRYLDVISVNYYTYGIEKDFVKKVHDWSGGRPIIFSEWYYSSTDHGLGGGKEVKDQGERGLAYRNYIEQAIATGCVVGSQWFIYGDQSITGRFFEGFNGEGNNTGLIDVADRPYAPLIVAAASTHARVYDVLLGREKPFAYDDARFSGKGAGPAKIVAAPRALPGLQLNGSTTNWPGRPTEPIGANRLMMGNPNEKLGGDFRLCWDDRALHFLIQVKDPTPRKNNKPGAYYWSADCVELFIGSKNLKEGGGLQFTDRQILLGTGEKPGVFVVDHPDAAKDCRVIVVKEVAGDGYTLQVEIPWTVLGVEPRAGAELLFDVAIDNSDDGETRAQQLVWSGTDKNSGDRGAWGRARLVEN